MAADRQNIISMTTNSIRDEFVWIISQLVGEDDRDRRVQLFANCLKKISDEARILFDLSRKKERHHILHVRMTLDAIEEHPKDHQPHDFSKDDLYFFVTSSKFDYRITCDDLDQLFLTETERHYRLEPHHEQFERIQNKECDTDDIREMAIDRLSRNIQSNHGSVNMDEMERYLPNFALGDKNKKLEIYRQYVKDHKELTIQCYSKFNGLKV